MQVGSRVRSGAGVALVALLAGICFGAEAQAPGGAPAAPDRGAAPASPETHPNLSGYWGQPGPGLEGLGSGPGDNDGGVRAPLRNGDISNLTNDNVIARRSGDNLPLYKPQFWARVKEMDRLGNKRDPFPRCMPVAPPRIGPPARIVQTGDELFFFYRVPFQQNTFRVIPVGKRDHPLDPDGTWTGDPVAHWEGDTLVVVTEGFNDQSWLGPEGYIHGYDLKTTERFRRDGDVLVYQVTVEDPEYLQKPWVLAPQRLAGMTGARARLEDSPPCSDRDSDHTVGTQREI